MADYAGNQPAKFNNVDRQLIALICGINGSADWSQTLSHPLHSWFLSVRRHIEIIQIEVLFRTQFIRKIRLYSNYWLEARPPDGHPESASA